MRDETSLVVQWLGVRAPNAGAPGLIPDQGTRSFMAQLRAGTAREKRIDERNSSRHHFTVCSSFPKFKCLNDQGKETPRKNPWLWWVNLSLIYRYQPWIRFPGLWQQSAPNGMAYNNRNEFSQFQRLEVQNQGVSSREDSFLASSSDPRSSLVCGSITPISTSVFTWPSSLLISLSSFLITTQIIGYKPHPTSRMILPWDP